MQNLKQFEWCSYIAYNYSYRWSTATTMVFHTKYNFHFLTENILLYNTASCLLGYLLAVTR